MPIRISIQYHWTSRVFRVTTSYQSGLHAGRVLEDRSCSKTPGEVRSYIRTALSVGFDVDYFAHP